jgi:hypothetical protein
MPDLLFYEPYPKVRPASRPLPTPRLSMGPKSFVLNKAAVDLLELRINQRILFAQDSQNAQDWYLSIHAERGYTLHPASANRMTFFSRELRRKIVAALPYAPVATASFVLDAMPVVQESEQQPAEAGGFGNALQGH